MNVPLQKPIVFFDIESTGLHVLRDRIIQIALIKYLPGQSDPEELMLMINPGVPISEEAMAVHGILPKDLANKPTFQQVAKTLHEFIGDADLGGFGLMRMDIPMLMEEFARAGYDFPIDKRRIVDVQRIFYRMEPRTLKAAYRFYCEQELEDAHDAMADVRATIGVLQGQIARYEGEDLITEDGERVENPIVPDVQALHDFTNDARMIDPTQKLKLDHNGVVVFNFGKYQGQPVAQTLFEDQQYYNWILNKEFSTQVKQLVKQLLKDYKKSLRN